MLAVLLAPATAGLVGPTVLEGPQERTFVLVMDGTSFNGRTWPDTLIEANVGDALRFIVLVPPAVAEPHVFHLHGHPWFDEAEGRFIDAKLLMPGQVHEFTVVAGGEGRHAGDWLYHCHMDSHFEDGMVGLLRVHDGVTSRAPPQPVSEVLGLLPGDLDLA